MIDLNSIRNPIVSGLRTYTGIVTIMAEQSSQQPSYPFYGLKFTTPGVSVGLVTEYQDGENTVVEQDLELILSVTSYSHKLDESFNNAYKALEWFKGKGWLALSDIKIHVVRIEPMTNRDTFLNIEYERRHGFDVRLRVRGQVQYLAGSIVEVII